MRPSWDLGGDTETAGLFWKGFPVTRSKAGPRHKPRLSDAGNKGVAERAQHHRVVLVFVSLSVTTPEARRSFLPPLAGTLSVEENKLGVVQIENKQTPSNGPCLERLEVNKCFLALELLFSEYLYTIELDHNVEL